MLKIIFSIITIVSLCALVVLLNFTTPISAGPFGILAIFIFAYLLLVCLIAYFLHGISRIAAHLSIALISRRPFEVIKLKRSYYYSTILAAAPIMLVGLQSVGAVGIYEILLVLLFVVIGCLYVSKRVS